jgi:micrococcal nuclease
MKKYALILLAAFNLLGVAPAAAATIDYQAKVIKVIDGDTIKVVIAGWPVPYNPDDVRIDGIDTPEKRMPPGKSLCEVKLGEAASAYAKTVIRLGSTVVVHYDTTKHDKYGRLLGTVTLEDGRDYGKLMVDGGFAKPYDGGTKSIWCPVVKPTVVVPSAPVAPAAVVTTVITTKK